MSTSQFKPQWRDMYRNSQRQLSDVTISYDDLQKQFRNQGRALSKRITQCKHLDSQIKDKEKEIKMLKEKLQCREEKPNNVAAAITSVCILGIMIILYLGGK